MKAWVPKKDGSIIIDREENKGEYIKAVGIDQYFALQREEAREQEDDRLRRIKSVYSPGKVNLILSIEKAYDVWNDEETEDNMNKLLRRFEWCVRKWAKHYWINWSKWWFTKEDFESYFWEETQKVIEFYSCNSKFYLYEQVDKKLYGRGYDFIRMNLGTKQGYFEREASRFPDGFEDKYPSDFNPEKQVTDKLLIDQMIEEPSLTAKERKLLAILYENPDASNSELAELMGFNHREQVRRARFSIKKKLETFREDALSSDALTQSSWQYNYKKRTLAQVEDDYENEQRVQHLFAAQSEENPENDDSWDREQEEQQKTISLAEEKAKAASPLKKKKRKKRKYDPEKEAERRRRRRLKKMNIPLNDDPNFDPTSVF
ncbi:MAG: hypothetical protein FH756_10300 [Firmicutes bacterium]|nr:hypothetical protein [Bacillota bacterium]